MPKTPMRAFAIEADFAATIEAEVAKVIDLAIESATAVEGVAAT